GLTLTVEIGILLPTLSVACALLRVMMEGDCSTRRSVTSSSALMIAAALRPRKVHDSPLPTLPMLEPVTLPAIALQVVRPSADGSPASVTARSKNQFTP